MENRLQCNHHRRPSCLVPGPSTCVGREPRFAETAETRPKAPRKIQPHVPDEKSARSSHRSASPLFPSLMGETRRTPWPAAVSGSCAGESKQATDAAELCGHRICSGQVSDAGTRRTSYERGSSGGGRREIQKSALAAQGGHGSGAATLPWLCRPSLSPPPAPPSTCHPLSSMHAPRRRRRPLPRGSTSY